MATSRSALRTELIGRLDRTSLFAILDAAAFDHFEQATSDASITARPLFLDELEIEALVTGPHLVEIADRADVDRVLDMLDGRSAAVWWSWPRSAEAAMELYRHLRTINMVDLPEDRDDRVRPRKGSHAPVVFRHADPNVMAMTLPVLDEAQIARLFGAATEVIVDAPHVCGLRCFARPASLPEPPPGLLRIRDVAQYALIAEGYTEAMRRRAVLEFAPAVSDDEAVSEPRILDAFERAEGYAFGSQEEVWEFIALDVEFGARFELELPFADALGTLRSNDISGFEKISLVKTQAGVVRGLDGLDPV